MNAETMIAVGDKVELVGCSNCAAGEVVDRQRGRLLVVFSDMPQAKWLLKPDSLRLVSAQAQAADSTKGTPPPDPTG